MKIKEFLHNLQFIFKPEWWFMNYPYSSAVDAAINKLLENNEFEIQSHHTAKLGEYEIWITNRPYASITFHNPRIDLRPSRLTIKKCLKKIDKILSEQIKKDEKKIRETLHKIS